MIKHLDLIMAFRELIKQLDVKDKESLKNTPQRLAKMFENELLVGYRQDPEEILSKRFLIDKDDMIIVKDIPFVSLCSHHWLPFHGVAHVAYIPNKQDDSHILIQEQNGIKKIITKFEIVGLSKISRLVNCYAKRFQLQEQMTNEIADSLYEYLNPAGCAIITKAQHMCSYIRGIKSNSSMICSAIRGAFEKPEVKSEFLRLLEI